jgi:hypothetical protein
MIALVITGGNGLLFVVVIASCVAITLHAVALLRSSNSGQSALSQILRSTVVTLVALPLWLGVFLIVSWLTVEVVLIIGLALAIPLSATSSGLLALLRIGPFARPDPQR